MPEESGEGVVVFVGVMLMVVTAMAAVVGVVGGSLE
jgi:hypothetical protein